MKAIVKKLQGMNQDRFYVIDFMPNLKWLLGNSCFIKDCTNEFRVFEEKVSMVENNKFKPLDVHVRNGDCFHMMDFMSV